ncbi:unnamed protein product [Paramecium octaurelia]|uniref:Uncharacterized protein n=1 Tax=Paramecium octaurelia TaxID=43137 RepID=A0A8S1TEK6_PAROT|nr:unnamed protein product [Paramecium octaurelia]
MAKMVQQIARIGRSSYIVSRAYPELNPTQAPNFLTCLEGSSNWLAYQLTIKVSALNEQTVLIFVKVSINNLLLLIYAFCANDCYEPTTYLSLKHPPIYDIGAKPIANSVNFHEDANDKANPTIIAEQYQHLNPIIF